MLTYDLSQREGMPLYEYLYHRIREDILSGTLPAESPLPSKRSFALQLGISTITVENAYAQLQAEGYIYAKPRKGFFVSGSEELDLLRPYTHRERTQEAGVLSEHKQNTNPQEPAVSWFADLAGNQTDPAMFPFSNWAKLTRRTLSERQADLMNNAPSEGVMELRQAIARQLSSFRGMHVQSEQIVIGAGTEFLYGLLIQLLGFDRIYANEDPGYARPSAVFQAYGVRHVRIPLDEGGISIRELEKSGADVVHVTPSHHFPTGMVTGPERRRALLEWAEAAAGRWLIEDDYDSEMPLSVHALLPLFAADQGQHVIYMNTFTKSLAPTIRISYMVLPEILLQRYRDRLGFYSSPVPVSDQYVLAAFLKEGYFESHVNRMRNVVHRKYAALREELGTEASARYFHVTGGSVGTEFQVELKAEIHAEEFEKQLRLHGIRIRPMSQYYADPLSPYALCQSGKYVLNYSSLPLSDIKETVERMRRAAEKAMEKGESREEQHDE